MERFKPIEPGASPDAEINQILEAAKSNVWADFRLFGMIAHRPAFLKAMLPVFQAIFETGTIPPRTKDMMRVATGYEWGCEY